MFSDFGFSEFLLIVAVGVLLIAPKELPNILKTLYKGYYKILSFKSTMEMKIEEETEQILGSDFIDTIHKETYNLKDTISNSLTTPQSPPNKNSLAQEKEKIRQTIHSQK